MTKVGFAYGRDDEIDADFQSAWKIGTAQIARELEPIDRSKTRH